PATIRSRCQRLPLVAQDDELTVDTVAGLAKVDPPRARAALALAGNDPELALENLRPEVWSALAGLTQKLIDVAQGRLDSGSLAVNPKGEGAVLLQRWSRLIALAVRGEHLGSAPFDAWVDLTSRLEMSTLLPLATQLERARGMAGSGVREDLLIYDLAARWSQAFNHGERRRGT
ncbi:MAG TPA: hypothetical protein VN259_03550, partial [Xanthomonadales bacterium]|nr:hypothetical protein [Xanthomonadales bacterium]